MDFTSNSHVSSKIAVLLAPNFATHCGVRADQAARLFGLACISWLCAFSFIMVTYRNFSTQSSHFLGGLCF
jgi:hypothetical protein